MIALALKRPVTMAMGVLVVLVFGLISYTELGRDLLPEIAYPSLTVMTRYQGAAPLEVEEFITKRLESALATIKGKRRISSISREGLSLITVEFDWGQDMQIATLHVREKLDVARFQVGFPQEAERPNILKWDPSAKPIVSLAVTGDAPILDLREGVQEIVKPRLEQLDGVALAQISGDVERVIDVEVNREMLALFHLSLDDVRDAIDRSNQNIAGGTIRKGRYRYALRTLGEFNSVAEIQDVMVAVRDGAPIRIRDIAQVRDTVKDRQAMAFVNGKEAIGLLVYKEAGANTILTTRSIKALLGELNLSHPDFHVTLAHEQAQFISQALNNVTLSVLFGGLFAFVVLLLFLGDLKSPVFVFLSIPVAIISSLVLMYFFDITLNIMSLGGLALGVGMLVDNSIVVLENIYRYREQGLEPYGAAYRGAREVAAPVTASTLTTIAVFFPIVYLQGIAGALFGEQALTVTFAMLSSLVVSLTILPLLTALGASAGDEPRPAARYPALDRAEAKSQPRPFWFWKWWEFVAATLVLGFVCATLKLNWIPFLKLTAGLWVLPILLFVLKKWLTYALAALLQASGFGLSRFFVLLQALLNRTVLALFNWAYRGFESIYQRMVVWALNHKFLTLSVALVLLAASVIGLMDAKRELMPRSATGQFTIDWKGQPGSALEVTRDMVATLESALLSDPAVEVVFTQVGASEANLAQLLRESGTHAAQLSIKMRDDFVSLEEVRRLSQLTRDFVSRFPDVEVAFSESESSLEDLLQTEGGAGLTVQVEGERLDELYQVSQQLANSLMAIPQLKDVHNSFKRDYPQIHVDIHRQAIERYGFSLAQVGATLSDGMRGVLATQYKEFDRRIDVRVRFSQALRDDFDDVLETTLLSSDNSPVPLRELVDVQLIHSAQEIRRINQNRVAMVQAGLGALKISEVLPAVEKVVRDLSLPTGVQRPKVVGEQSGIHDAFSQLTWALILSSILVYMIMAAQFESFRNPFIVIFTVPMGLIGTALVLALFDQSINIMSLIGLIVLSGIVVNDAIVKVDFIQQRRGQGIPLRNAILEASHIRLRPILMTTATTVLALVPMAFMMLPRLVHWPLIAPLVHRLDQALRTRNWMSLTELFSARGAEIQQPLALVVIGGLSVATLMTLILIPVLYEALASPDPTPEPTSTEEPDA